MASEGFEPPEWALWPPMRALPKRKEEREAVLRKWADLIFEWASKTGKVLVDLLELSRTPPFDLPMELLRSSVEELVRSKRARWREPGRSVVLFWRSRDSWSSSIYRWLKENFKEVFSIHDLMEAGEDFSYLPPEELRECLKLLEKSGLVKKLRKVRGYYKLVLPGV
ncbi:hypothetical protein DRO32_01635 [Candidatus Bathyarchaeota archaeon]|nr:MAG: hypothetical protein DRO32_01635 [Candidatus Bathyarchaeota archaeon]